MCRHVHWRWATFLVLMRGHSCRCVEFTVSSPGVAFEMWKEMIAELLPTAHARHLTSLPILVTEEDNGFVRQDHCMRACVHADSLTHTRVPPSRAVHANIIGARVGSWCPSWRTPAAFLKCPQKFGVVSYQYSDRVVIDLFRQIIHAQLRRRTSHETFARTHARNTCAHAR